MADKNFYLKIVTPERIVFEGEVQSVMAQGTKGSFQVLADHVPFMTTLDIDIAKVEKDGETLVFSIIGGAFQFRNNEAIILSKVAELGDDIDTARAKQAKEEAEKVLDLAKNEAEIKGFRQAMVRDGIAMVRFLIWLEVKMAKGEEVTELSADGELTRQRSYQPLFRDISFDTIAGYGAHGAIVHYEPTPESDIPLQPKGLLLLDSGAQYMDGTTDITRTIALGTLTEDERRDYTLVLKGNIALSRAHFPHGTCGTQLDVLARQFMWAEGINYLHGTGHGVGSYLNVHEGPHQFRMNHMPALLLPGMTVTNEPGIYRAGSHGVRIENMMLIIPDKETDFGTYYQFEILTLCPIDTRPIVREMMTPDELQWLNAYHQQVYDALAPHLDEEEKAWLKEKTKEIKQ